MKIEPGYEPLAAILQEALEQAQHGKGKVCHANGKPFLEQPIMSGGRECGAGGLAFQARKKILEALNCADDDRAIADLLGAINYTAAMVILRREEAKPEPCFSLHNIFLERVIDGGVFPDLSDLKLE